MKIDRLRRELAKALEDIDRSESEVGSLKNGPDKCVGEVEV